MDVGREPVEITAAAQIRDVVRRIPVAFWIVLFVTLALLLFVHEQADLLRTSIILRRADVRWLLVLALGSLTVQVLYALGQTSVLRNLGHRAPVLPVVEANLQRHAVSAVAPVGAASEAYFLSRRLSRIAVPTDDIVFAVVITSAFAHVTFVLVLLPTLGWLMIEDQLERRDAVGSRRSGCLGDRDHHDSCSRISRRQDPGSDRSAHWIAR